MAGVKDTSDVLAVLLEGGHSTIAGRLAEVRRRVAAGQFAIGLTDSDDANVALGEGAPIAVVFPAGAEGGQLIVPCAALPKSWRRVTRWVLLRSSWSMGWKGSEFIRG